MLLLLAAALADPVPMRDGVSLATDVFAPTGEGPWPTVLRRTPYGRAFDADAVEALLALGYVVVSQDVRGRGDSQGRYRPFFDDGPDGADTVDWITAQPWSDGQVVMYGGSAESIVQFLAAGEGPAGLVAIQPFQGTPDLRRSLYPGGAWREELTTAWLASLEESDAEDRLRELEADGADWDPVRLDAAEWARSPAAGLLVGGFFDIFEGEMAGALADAQAHGDAPVWLVLGPWVHGGSGGSTQGEVEFPGAVYDAFYTDLFTHWSWRTRGGPAPDWPPVRYAVSTFADRAAVATTEWLEADTWPPPAQRERLYLGVDGLGAAPGGDPVVLPVDPDDPVPSVGGGNLTTAAGVYDQAEVDARADVYVAATAPREETVTVAGDLSATIWAASATTDVDVIVRVEVATPGGRAWLIGDGVRRGRFVGGEDAVRPLTPGEPARFEIDLGPAAVTLPPGHTLRISVSGTLWPRYERNPNEALPLVDRAEPVPTTLTLFRDADHPSVVEVPLLAGSLGGGPAEEPEEPDDPPGPGADPAPGCGCASGGPAPVGLGLLGLLALRRRRAPTG